MPDESKESLSVRMRQSAALDTPHFIRAVVSGWADEVRAWEEALRRAEARIAALEEALPKIREAIRHTFGGMHPTSALWGNSQYDKGHTSGVLAALTAFDTEVAKQQALAQPTAPQGASE